MLRAVFVFGHRELTAHLPDVLRIRGKGGKERIVPVLPAARDSVAAYVRLCPFPVASEPARFE